MDVVRLPQRWQLVMLGPCDLTCDPAGPVCERRACSHGGRVVTKRVSERASASDQSRAELSRAATRGLPNFLPLYRERDSSDF